MFRELAIASPLAAAAAQLTGAKGTGGEGRDLCVVRDAYFRLKGENKGCNFHVDDSYY